MGEGGESDGGEGMLGREGREREGGEVGGRRDLPEQFRV